jgi:hypothetical protein
VLGKIGAQVSPLTPGKWLIGVSLPLTGAWISAAGVSKTDLFIGPFFWVFAYMLVVGIGLFVWGAVTTPISLPKTMPNRRPAVMVLWELALGVAFFFLFSALVTN